MRRSRIVLSVLLSLGSIGARAATPAEIERKIDSLVAGMTLEEKLGQMSQATFPETLTDQLKAEIRQGRWGSFLDGGTPAERAEVQRIATQESRTKIPLIFGQDVIHGYRTVFPIPLGQSASWDPELVRQAARIAAREAAAAGIHWTFAPMMDIARDPRWGRIAETLGEDPYLAGVLAAAMVRGFQGDSLAAADSVAACAKHYVGYGAAEGGRDYNTTWIPEVLLRNVYLRPFHAAREAGVASYMTAFNDLNGVPASGNEFTVRQVLRNEWKFDGFVVSDYTAIHELIAHGYAADASRCGVQGHPRRREHGDDQHRLLRQRQGPDRIRAPGRPTHRCRRAQDPARQVPAGAVRWPLAVHCGRRRAGPGGPRDRPETGGRKPRAAQERARHPAAGQINRQDRGDRAAHDSPVDQMGTWARNGDAGAVRTPLNAPRQMLGEARVAWAPGLKVLPRHQPRWLRRGARGGAWRRCRAALPR